MFAHLIMNSNEYPSCPLVKPLQAPVNESPSIQFVSKQAVDPSAPISTALAALEGWAFKLQYGEPNLTHDGVIINVQSLQTDLSDGTNFVLQSRIADIRYLCITDPAARPVALNTDGKSKRLLRFAWN
jgi:hypothetical protein